MATIELLVPDDLCAKLNERAAIAGVSVETYLLGLFEEIAEIPTEAEMEELVSALPPWPVARIARPPESSDA